MKMLAEGFVPACRNCFKSSVFTKQFLKYAFSDYRLILQASSTDAFIETTIQGDGFGHRRVAKRFEWMPQLLIESSIKVR